jgi:hypothetical protein
LKHSQRPFVVETKRRRGRPSSTSVGKIDDEVSAAVRAHSLRYDAVQNSQLAEPSDEVLPAQTAGRILPSLTEDCFPKLVTQQPEALLARFRTGRPKNSQASLSRTPAIQPSPSTDDGEIGTASASVVGLDGSGKYGPKPKKRGASGRRAPRAATTQPIVAVERNSVETDSNGDAGISSRRRGLILGRYVYRTELKPGERWKARFRKDRF